MWVSVSLEGLKVRVYYGLSFVLVFVVDGCGSVVCLWYLVWYLVVFV